MSSMSNALRSQWQNWEHRTQELPVCLGLIEGVEPINASPCLDKMGLMTQLAREAKQKRIPHRHVAGDNEVPKDELASSSLGC